MSALIRTLETACVGRGLTLALEHDPMARRRPYRLRTRGVHAGPPAEYASLREARLEYAAAVRRLRAGEGSMRRGVAPVASG